MGFMDFMAWNAAEEANHKVQQLRTETEQHTRSRNDRLSHIEKRLDNIERLLSHLITKKKKRTSQGEKHVD